ncbi:sensor histidine kinase [Herbidospora cretacea]|uniref:sensor histidine kinase n=1 Tax=Herbidospora cretacea TaxID=28444 RepID=UPI0012FB1A96|nr:ATP-binding protein [Herbidospora cretacea]
MALGVRLDAGGRMPATAALDRVTARCAAVMRGVAGVVAAAAALLALAPPVEAGVLVPVVAGLLCWSVFFLWAGWTRGLLPQVVVFEVLITSALCVFQRDLVAGTLIGDSASWVGGLVTMTIVVINLTWRAGPAVPAGLVVVAAHLIGSGAFAVAGIHVLQVVATALLMSLLRKGAADADAELAAARDAEEKATVERERRRDERAQNSRMHGSVLATLMMIGAGGIGATSPMLRETAARHLADLDRMSEGGGTGPDHVPLHDRLAAGAARSGLVVHTRLVPVSVPWEVGEAFLEAVAEALANVLRHANVTTATVTLTEDDGLVAVEVRDRGMGFDVAGVPDHRYGLRVSILARMEMVGGRGVVESGPQGTRVTLRWTR